MPSMVVLSPLQWTHKVNGENKMDPAHIKILTKSDRNTKNKNRHSMLMDEDDKRTQIYETVG